MEPVPVQDTSIIDPPSENRNSQPLAGQICRNIVFVPHKEVDFGGLEKHLLDFLERLREPGLQLSIICFGKDVYTERFDPDRTPNIAVKLRPEPITLSDWVRLFRECRADIAVFCYGWIGTFSWQAPAGAILAGVKKRFAIQHLVPPPLPSPVEGSSLRDRLRPIFGHRARRFFGWRVAAHLCNKTICVSNAVRDPLVRDYRFPSRKTIVIHNGVSTSTFGPSRSNGAAVRARFNVRADDFLLVCVARLGKAKGIDILLQAVSEVIRRGIAFKCILLGGRTSQRNPGATGRVPGIVGALVFRGVSERCAALFASCIGLYPHFPSRRATTFRPGGDGVRSALHCHRRGRQCGSR